MHFDLLLNTKILSETIFYNTDSALVEYFCILTIVTFWENIMEGQKCHKKINTSSQLIKYVID